MNKAQKEVQQAFLNSEEEVLRQLNTIYHQAQVDVEEKIFELYSRKDTENLQSIIYQVEYQKAIKKQIESTLDNLNSAQFETVSDYLTKCYEEGYLGTMYDLKSQGIPLTIPIDQKAVVRAVKLDSKIKKSMYEHFGERVEVLKQDIAREISRGISTGIHWNQVARNITQNMMGDYKNPKGSFAYAMRIARTEGHRIQIQSAMDAQQKAKERGADIVKQWDATLDGNTRPDHQKLDGQIRELDEKFKVGSKTADAPGLFGDPSEDCNCRCALLQRARWALDQEELDTLNERAEYFGLDKTKDFEDFKQKYLNNVTDEDIPESYENSFVGDLMNKEYSPHQNAFNNYQDYRDAEKEFVGQRTEYFDDKFNTSNSGLVGNAIWANYDDKIPMIENTLVELQNKYPIPVDSKYEHGSIFERINIADYDYVHIYLPNGKDDRRLDNSAVGQVFKNDKTVTIGFSRNAMYQTIEKAMEERTEALAKGEILLSVGGDSPQTVAIHEWGHIMSEHFDSAFIYQDETVMEYWDWYKSLSKDEIKKGISSYAATNRGEFEAECFAELQMPNPRPVAVKYGEYLDAIIEKGY